ncbi:MAG: hypothetical protein K1X66_07290 [Verrucomicrobiae bacterium]|nr:hypothetical protein [Verrucomicrobiae bacterium]
MGLLSQAAKKALKDTLKATVKQGRQAQKDAKTFLAGVRESLTQAKDRLPPKDILKAEPKGYLPLMDQNALDDARKIIRGAPDQLESLKVQAKRASEEVGQRFKEVEKQVERVERYSDIHPSGHPLLEEAKESLAIAVRDAELAAKRVSDANEKINQIYDKVDGAKETIIKYTGYGLAVGAALTPQESLAADVAEASLDALGVVETMASGPLGALAGCLIAPAPGKSRLDIFSCMSHEVNEVGNELVSSPAAKNVWNHIENQSKAAIQSGGAGIFY